MANNDLINRKHCKETALRMAEDMRLGWKTTRVSKQFLDDLNTMVRNRIANAIKRHPSVGETIKYLFWGLKNGTFHNGRLSGVRDAGDWPEPRMSNLRKGRLRTLLRELLCQSKRRIGVSRTSIRWGKRMKARWIFLSWFVMISYSLLFWAVVIKLILRWKKQPYFV